MNVLEQVIENKYAIYNGDSCEIVRAIPDNSIHYTIFSPPFASLYTYSNSDRDMGNSKGDDEFYNHFIFLAKELYRVTMPGRLLSFHCMDLPLMKERDGVIGLKDFPAIIRKIFEDCGFIYHSKVTIWKNPVTEMQRTKSLGLLHKQIRKDSTMNRQGIPDYIVTMRKPGENPEPIDHPEGFTCYYGDDEPQIKMYQTDKKFLSMVNNHANDFKQLGESNDEGVIDIHLVRKDLPKGFFFRPVGYNDRIKIKYMGATEIMLQSEGEYNKRQIRLKMYTRVGK